MASQILNSTLPDLPHPFYPLEANVVGYLANDVSVPTLLGAFAVGCVAILATTNTVARTFNPKLTAGAIVTISWFVLSGSIHLFFEGYFAYNHHRMPAMQDLFGQMWKEYSLSDSRYLTSDPFVLCMESVTAILWGPLSFLVAVLITIDHPLRYPLQATVSLGQLYGDVLYYATSMFDHYYKGLTYCRPEAYYFWCYYFALNFIWIVIPSYLLYQSMAASARAFRVASKSTNTNGSLKKNG